MVSLKNTSDPNDKRDRNVKPLYAEFTCGIVQVERFLHGYGGHAEDLRVVAQDDDVTQVTELRRLSHVDDPGRSGSSARFLPPADEHQVQHVARVHTGFLQTE